MKIGEILEHKPIQVRMGGALWRPRLVALRTILKRSEPLMEYSISAEYEGLGLHVWPNEVTGCWQFSLRDVGDWLGLYPHVWGHGDTARHAMIRAEREAELRAERLRSKPPSSQGAAAWGQVVVDLEAQAGRASAHQ